MEPVADVLSERRVSWACPCCYPAKNLSAIIHTHAGGDRTWTLYPYHRTKRRPPAIAGKRCPNCGQDFSRLSVGELLSSVWPGGRAE
jgi:hypothetical protein